MAHLLPEQYYPCLAPLEKEAVRLIYGQFVPLYFVVLAQPLKDLYAASPVNFEGRLESFLEMFHASEAEVDLPPFPEPQEVWVGFYDYYLEWALYDPISTGVDTTRCRESDYTLDPA